MSARTLTGLGAALLVGIGASLATAAGIDNYSNVTCLLYTSDAADE